MPREAMRRRKRPLGPPVVTGGELLPPVLAQMARLGHTVFTRGDYNLNFFGIRSAFQRADKFDDLRGCAYKKEGHWVVEYWPATTDAGGAYTTKPTERGVAVLAPGQYRGAYMIGPHGQTRYDALVQRGGEVGVYRDKNGNGKVEAFGPVQWGYFGINIHAPSSRPYTEKTTRESVGVWSAGCQVHATTTGFQRQMTLARKQVELTGHPRFSYTLLKQWW